MRDPHSWYIAQDNNHLVFAIFDFNQYRSCKERQLARQGAVVSGITIEYMHTSTLRATANIAI